MRQVKFSMRSRLGSWDLVLLYRRHIWVARGSSRCMASGLSGSRPPLSSFQMGKTVSPRTPLRVAVSCGEKSSLESSVLADVSDWMADEEALE